MRDLKFRAWDLENKKMFYNDIVIDCWNDGSWHYSVNSVANNEKNLIFMQYTGLKDKNGKEIYEGDIVSNGVIVFDKGAFRGCYYESIETYPYFELSDVWEDDFSICEVEVIGNIYENPELLKLEVL